jgi:hypothetical protein
LNLYFISPRGDKIDYVKDRFYEELEHIFDNLPEYCMKMLGDFNDKIGRADIFKSTIWNESLHEISNDNGVRVVNFATSNISLSKVRCFHIPIFINILQIYLQMAKPTIRLTIFR